MAMFKRRDKGMNGKKIRKDPYRGALEMLEDMYPNKLRPSLDYLLKQMDEIKDNIASFEPLNSSQKTALQKFEIEYTHDTNSMDGNGLSLNDTYQVLFDDIAIANKKVSDHIAMINHRDAWQYAKYKLSTENDLDKNLMLSFHKFLRHAIDPIHAGRFREVEIEIPGATHKPPHPEELEPAIDEYFQFYEDNKDEMNPILLAARMHYKLAIIHPFKKGNGFISRLICNFILKKHGYPLFNIPADLENKMHYFHALDGVYGEKGDEHFCVFVTQILKNCALNHLATIIVHTSKTRGIFFDRVIEKLGSTKMKILINNIVS